MPIYTGSAANQAPLIIQVQASFGDSPIPGQTPGLEVVAANAEGSSTTGSAARPVLYRPGTPGSRMGASVPEFRSQETGIYPGSLLLTTFTSNPSLPAVNLGVGQLPIRTEWHCQAGGLGIFVAYGGALVLYGNCSGGHQFSGSLSWEPL